MNLALQNFCQRPARYRDEFAILHSPSSILAASVCHGPSLSSSASTQQSAQTTVEGSAGTSSPTVVGGGNVSYNDPAVAQAILSTIGTLGTQVLGAGSGIATTALNNEQQTQNQVSQDEAAQSSENTALLQAVLSGQQQLALSNQTGGTSLTDTSNNYLIIGALAVAGIAVIVALSHR